jgi:pimeloyl-ACP methyl ester carboxylesterase
MIPPHPIRGTTTVHLATIIAPRGGGRGPGRLPLFAATAVLALSTPAVAGEAEDGPVIRDGSAELRLAVPYQAGKVSVVFVHGLLGSPGSWSVMIDHLSTDPTVRAHFQFLTFRYDSLQSIPESGLQLLEALDEARRRFDPEGRDPSFDRVVLVGHSLGGLVAKAATNTPDHRAFGAGVPPPDGQRRPATPRVGRVIFIATPHRGAPVDRGVVRSVGIWLAREVSPSFANRRPWGVAGAESSLTSVDQLTWDHPLLRDLERAGAAAEVPFHSIIAALREPSAEGATDGVVPVASARLGNARSEVVVRANHICYHHPEVIQEVRRVLIEHAASLSRPPKSEPWRSPSVGRGRPDPARVEQFGIVVGTRILGRSSDRPCPRRHGIVGTTNTSSLCPRLRPTLPLPFLAGSTGQLPDEGRPWA